MTEIPPPSGTGDSPQEPLPAQPGPQPGYGQPFASPGEPVPQPGYGQQPPFGTWPEGPGPQPGYGQPFASPGGPVPQPGYGQQPPFGTWPGGPGFPVAPPRRRRTGLIIGIAVGLVVLIGAAIAVGALGSSGSSSHGSSGGRLILPAVLLSLPKYAGQSGQAINASLARQAVTDSKGTLVHVVGAGYGDQSGSSPGFAVVGGNFCGLCKANPPSKVVQFMVGRGFADARSFPPGSGGGTLVCGTQAGGTLIDCKWGNATTGGDILFLHGFASGLADAAAKARQILAIIEP